MNKENPLILARGYEKSATRELDLYPYDIGGSVI
jgi:hypothetical protein